LRVRAIGIDERLEEDCLVVDEPRATREKEWAEDGAVGRAGGKPCYRCAAAGREIEDDDLGGLLAPGARPAVRGGERTAERGEGYRRRKGDVGLETPLVARCAEVTRAARAVGADEEHPFLFRSYRQPGVRKLVVHLEHHTRAVRAHPEALQREHVCG